MEKFEYEFIEIVKSKLCDLDPVYVEEMAKLKRAMLLAKKSFSGQALSMFLTSKRRKCPEAFEALKQELG